jgi:hypothetical protein
MAARRDINPAVPFADLIIVISSAEATFSLRCDALVSASQIHHIGSAIGQIDTP